MGAGGISDGLSRLFLLNATLTDNVEMFWRALALVAGRSDFANASTDGYICRKSGAR